MEKSKFISIFLALIIITPLIFTLVIQVNDATDVCELVEKPAEEEQRSEQEPEKKEGKDGIDEFLLHHHFAITITENKKLDYSANRNKTSAINREILTPPPELV